jgi:CRISPR-associated protein Csb2
MSLVLEIEHLLGVAFAAQSPASSVPDWPPQPDRVFSALVAAWGARGERPDERRALEWLETQAAPELAASDGFARTAATAFVPPNDPQTGRVGDRTVLPALRRRQPRRFPAYRPTDPIVRLVWLKTEAGSATLAALNALAADTPYVGHSASLTRCRFSTDGAPAAATLPRRQVYRGRLAELERLHRAGRRPSPGEPDRSPQPEEPQPPHSAFADRWLVLEHVDEHADGPMPDLRASALIAKTLRDTLMAGYQRIGRGAHVPPEVSGHSLDGAPLAAPHLAIAPLAFAGWPHADGRVLGFALIPPGTGALLDNADFQRAIKEVAPWKDDVARRELRLVGRGFAVTLTPSGESTRRSLDPTGYVATAKTWASCTPIVLDRHLKATGAADRDREMRELIARACVNIGLPTPARIAVGAGDPTHSELAIAASKHSAFKGAPSAYPSGRAPPPWTRWRLPESLASRLLTHAVLQFDEPIRGPVILGAGRFVGLGLCRAFDAERG